MITGTRVSMRPLSPDDADSLYNLHCDIDTYLTASPLPHTPRTPQAIRQRLDRQAAEEPSPDKDIWLAVTSRTDDAFIGNAGLWGIDGFNRLAHVGMVLTREARRQGYGLDVLRTLVDYSFRVRNLRRVELETNASNQAMRRTAARCGFIEEGRLRQRHYDGDGYVDLVVYGRLRTEWLVAAADAGSASADGDHSHADRYERGGVANVHIG